MSTEYVLAVIGGSGLYEIGGLTHVETIAIDTPFGAPSDVIVRGRWGTTTLLFLPRHGRGHRLAPHEIPFRANICACKMLGATHLVSISAVGSMKESIVPGDFVVVDQFIDLTKQRACTFFEDGLVGHVSLADPVCDQLSVALASAAERVGVRVHRCGTYVCIEGPQFSTRAESLLYRSWGVSVIGMTAMPEAKLAREAELPFALLALATDYDCWHATEGEVNAAAVLKMMNENVAAAKSAVTELAHMLPDPARSRAAGALAAGLMTAPDRVASTNPRRMEWLVGKYSPP